MQFISGVMRTEPNLFNSVGGSFPLDLHLALALTEG
jgi:hypothetical protein